ncbi:MAG: hypothetical protein JW818_13560 [Pirellulales bacterium]|nr:hypothetical protein [Pirellulales bacterium]
MKRIVLVVVGLVISASVSLVPVNTMAWSEEVRVADARSPKPTGTKVVLLSDSLPTPPRQSAPWKPAKTKLPKEFVSTTQTLFDQGLADPRGCEYREIEVVVGGFEPPWNDVTVKIHGWVLPSADPKVQRMAVCWNGLVYPVFEVGKPADLRADVLAAVKGEPQAGIYGTGRIWAAYFENYCFCHPWEGRTVAHESLLPIKACLLLRLGEVDLAEKLWNRWKSRVFAYSMNPDETNADAVERWLKDPYLALANLWTLSLFDQALTAHLRGDDRLALIAAERLNAVRPKVVAEADKRGFRKPPKKKEESEPYFFLDPDQMRLLLADQRRRAELRRQGASPPVRAVDYPVDLVSDFDPHELAIRRQLNRCSGRAERIALLVRELEETTNCTGFMFTSYMSGWYLLGEGEAAVEPLLQCLEEDGVHLTRSSSMRSRFPCEVWPLAANLLSEVLAMPFGDQGYYLDWDSLAAADRQKTRKVYATEIRAYWMRYKDVKSAERWYRILADDDARPDQWCAAARAIVQPAFVPVTLERVAWGQPRQSWWNIVQRGDEASWTPHGAALRSKKDPSVSRLMAKRIKMIHASYRELVRQEVELEKEGKRLEELEGEPWQGIDPDDPEAEEYKKLEREYHELKKKRERRESDDLRKPGEKWAREQGCLASFQLGCDMACCLARWEPEAALPALRRLTATCHKAMNASKAADGSMAVSFPDRSDCLEVLVLARAGTGDLAVLDDYATWVRRGEVGVMELLYRYRDHPKMAETARRLFLDKASPWRPRLAPVWASQQKRLSLAELRSPRITLPAFRERLLQLLEDREQVGQAVVESRERILLGLEHPDEEASTTPDDPLCPPPGAKVPYRMCDACAYALSGLEGAPRCKLFWPEKERDRAVAQCRAFLKQYGYRYQLADEPVDASGGKKTFLEPYFDGGGTYDIGTRFALPILDHPATPEDVREGRAVFSLAGPGKTRILKTVSLPLRAIRRNAKGPPVNEKGERILTWFDGDGWVWQAEQQQQPDGRWQTFFGYVGPNGLEKVPAEELNLPTPSAICDFPSSWAMWNPNRRREPLPMTKRLDAVWTVSRKVQPGGVIRHAAGKPLVCTLAIRNHSGVEQAVPPIALKSDGTPPPDNAVTLDIHVRRRAGFPILYPLEPTLWTDVPPRKTSRFTLKPRFSSLGPAEERAILRFDVTEHFDLSQPGMYRVSVTFRGKDLVQYDAVGFEDILFEVPEKP